MAMYAIMSFSPRTECVHEFRRAGIGLVHQFREGGLGVLGLMPCVVERLELRVRVVTLRRFEKNVVRGVRVERRVEVDQINRLVRNGRPHQL